MSEMPRETADVDEVDVTIEEEQRSLFDAFRETWELWAVALAVTAGATFTMTTNVTGPVDEYLFTVLAVVGVLAAVSRTASRANYT